MLITNFTTIGIVPEGVIRATWELANAGQSTPIAVHPRLRGNVALAPWTRAPRSTSLLNEQLLVGATWYGPHGRIVARFADDLAAVSRSYAAPARRPPPTSAP